MRSTAFLVAGCILLASLASLPAQPPRATAPDELPPPMQDQLEKISPPPASGMKPPVAPDEAAPGDAPGQGQDTTRGTATKAKEPPPPDGRCDLCGACKCVRKVCVSKMTTKEIRKVCWDARSEDFCVPGRSIWCGKICRQDDCGCWTHDLWKPTCAEVRTRVVPVRKETKRTVPAVEWKVEERCACCRQRPHDAVAARPTNGEKQAGADDVEQASPQPRTLR